MVSFPTHAVLLLIDVQKGFHDPYWGKRNNPDAEKNIAKLLQVWRESSRPVVHVRHMSVEPNSPLRPGQRGNEFMDEVTPLNGEHVEEKNVNSAFIGTGLSEYLKSNQYDTLVIVGLTTDHCVSTSTRMAGNLGFNVTVIADATATFDRTGFDGQKFPAADVHACALASLHDEFAIVRNTDEVIRSILSTRVLSDPRQAL